MNQLHDRPQEPERSYNREYWESLHGIEPEVPFSRIPKCVMKRREDELCKSDDEATAKEEGKVLPVREPDNKAGGPATRAIGRGFTESEAREMFQ